MRATAMGKLTRDDALSCSQLPALMGEDNYGKTPNDVLRRCIEAMDGKPDDFTPNEAMGWGSMLEEPIVKEAADRLGMELLHGFATPFVAKDVPLQCSLDATITPILAKHVIETDPSRGIFVMNDARMLEVTTTGCLEAKLTSMAPEDAPPLHRGPLQLQGQMICTGYTWGAIATLYRGTELRIFVFERHPDTVAAITKAAKDFEARLKIYGSTGEVDWYPLASPEDGSRTFNEIKRKEVKLPEVALDVARDLMQAKDDIADAEKRESRATRELMELMGDAERGVCGHLAIVWGSRNYKAQPEKIVPAKPAYSVRNKSVRIEEVKS